jgi:hypothetical protein
MERTRFIEHRGQRIVLLDYTDLAVEADTLRAIEESRSFIAANRGAGSLLTCTDASGAHYTARVMEAVKALAAHNKPWVKAGATVSNSRMTRVVIAAVAVFTGRPLPVFATRQEALDWLVAR